MDDKEDEIININDFRNIEAITDEDEIIDISDKEFVEAIYASDGFDSPCCWLLFAPAGNYCAIKESIEWGHEEKDGIVKMVPTYFEDLLGNSYVYVK